MKEIITPKYGYKVFDKNSVILDITPMKTPLWIIILFLVVFSILIAFSPLVFKILALLLLLILL